jgi:cyclomaltodextrinase
MIRRSCVSLVVVLVLCGLFNLPGQAQPMIDGTDREIWVPTTTITGTIGDAQGAASVVVVVNGREYAADIDGTSFTAEIDLESGINTVSAVVYQSNGALQQGNTIQLDLRLPDLPKAVLDIEVEQGQVTLYNKSEPSVVSGAALVKHEYKPRNSNPAPIELGETGDVVSFTAPTVDGEYYIDLFVIDKNGHQDRAADYFVVEDGVAREVDLAKEHAAWIDSAVVYGVMPNNIGLFGFDSVIDHLDSLEELGVTTLWLSPIQDSLTFGHGYDLINYFEIREHYGTKDDFRRLVDNAHARGMRVIMDVVPNHTAADHRYFKDTLLYGEQSPYFDFYERDQNGQAEFYFDWYDLPNLNYNNPEVVNWITESLMYWVREFHIDGFRVDAVWGVKERKPEFWSAFRSEVTRIKPDILLVAEASARDDYYFTNGFDGAYDWTDQLGHWAWENVFTNKDLIVPRLHRALTNNGRGYHEDGLIFRFLNNNDTDYRFITRYGVELTRTAAALLLTLPGLPQIYTGQEVGAEFRPYYDNWPVSFYDEHDLFTYYQDLIRIRRHSPASESLQSREWQPVSVDSDGVYCYIRASEKGDPVLVVLNFSSSDQYVQVEVPEGFPELTTGMLYDLLGEEEIVESEQRTLFLELAPWQARIMMGQ